MYQFCYIYGYVDVILAADIGRFATVIANKGYICAAWKHCTIESMIDDNRVCHEWYFWHDYGSAKT